MDILKIDRSFISGTDTPKENAEIVCSIVDMAHSLGLRVTAEGVETQEQLDRLQSSNCDRAQGYMFSKPMIPEDAGEMIRTAILGKGSSHGRWLGQGFGVFRQARPSRRPIKSPESDHAGYSP